MLELEALPSSFGADFAALKASQEAWEKKKKEQVSRRKWRALQRQMMALAARAVQVRRVKEWLLRAEGGSGLGRALRAVQRSRHRRRSV